MLAHAGKLNLLAPQSPAPGRLDGMHKAGPKLLSSTSSAATPPPSCHHPNSAAFHHWLSFIQALAIRIASSIDAVNYFHHLTAACEASAGSCRPVTAPRTMARRRQKHRPGPRMRRPKHANARLAAIESDSGATSARNAGAASVPNALIPDPERHNMRRTSRRTTLT